MIRFLNEREGIDGILVQFPLPEHLDDRAVQLAIRPDKDVDCVHPSNVGDLTLGVDCFWPCTPAGVMRLLAEYSIDPAYKNCTPGRYSDYRRRAHRPDHRRYGEGGGGGH